MLRLTDAWKRNPPLYGPMALFICTRKPRFISTSPLSFTHGTRNMMTRSGSAMRSSIFIFCSTGFSRIYGAKLSTTSWTAW